MPLIMCHPYLWWRIGLCICMYVFLCIYSYKRYYRVMCVCLRHTPKIQREWHSNAGARMIKYPTQHLNPLRKSHNFVLCVCVCYVIRHLPPSFSFSLVPFSVFNGFSLKSFHKQVRTHSHAFILRLTSASSSFYTCM